MRKGVLPAAAVFCALAGTAMAAEFQPMGALGIGGAGVARTTNAMAAYWNPAGLAFSEQTFSMPVGGSAGYRITDGLAQDVDKLNKFTKKGSDGNSTFDNLKNINGLNPSALGDVVSLLSVLKDIQTKGGMALVGGNAVAAMQLKHFAMGAFASTEIAATPDIDLVNILPSSGSGSTPVDPSTFAGAAAGVDTTQPLKFFTDPSVRTNITNALIGAGFTADQANNVLYSVDSRLSSSSSGGPVPTLTQSQAADVLINTIAPAFKNGGAASINNNQSAVVLKSIVYTEFPIAFGHPIDLGRYGKLGIGGSIKVINGRVYNRELKLVENGSSVSSSNFADNMFKEYQETNNVTFDLGACYRYGGWLSLGVVGKNLTSPSFDSPPSRDQNGNTITRDASGNPVRNDKVIIKPQVRAGIALDPLSWLTFAADLDLTNNESAVLLRGDNKIRNLGGGVEIHPASWFKVRGGMYKNLSSSDSAAVATAGLTFGTKWVNLDVDGAYGLQSAKYNNSTIPEEARVQSNLNIQF